MIKMAPLIKEMESSQMIDSRIVCSGQHRDLPGSVMQVFGLKPDCDLGVMEEKQTLIRVTGRILDGMDAVLAEIKPDLVLVQGDTSTALAAALSAFYRKIPVGHVEAGLRTNDKYAPFPEEMNRTLITDIADLHFCPTAGNRRNLIQEGAAGLILVTGNTAIDAMKTTVRKDYAFSNPVLRQLDYRNRKCVVLTCHRRENLGAPMTEILEAVRTLAARHEEIDVVCPVHPNPAVRESVLGILKDSSRVYLVDPLDVLDMHNLLDRCSFVMTDSGGLQEEAPALGKPVLVLRDKTERPEAVEAGTVRLVGTKREKILSSAEELLTDEAAYDRMAHAASPYGDGFASGRIIDGILWYFGKREERPEEFSFV